MQVSRPSLRTVCWRCQIRQGASTNRSFHVSQKQAAENDGPDRRQRSRIAFDQISKFASRPSNRGGAVPTSGFRDARPRGGDNNAGRGFNIRRVNPDQTVQSTRGGSGRGGRGAARAGRGGRGVGFGARGGRPRDANNPLRRGTAEAGGSGEDGGAVDIDERYQPLLAPTNYDVLVDEDEADFANLEEAKHYGQAMDFMDRYYSKFGHPIEQENTEPLTTFTENEDGTRDGEHSVAYMREALRAGQKLVFFDFDGMPDRQVRDLFETKWLGEDAASLSEDDLAELRKQASEVSLKDMREQLIRDAYNDQIYNGEGASNVPLAEMRSRLKAGVMLIPRRLSFDDTRSMTREELEEAFERHVTDVDMEISQEEMLTALKSGGLKHPEDVYDVDAMDDAQIKVEFERWNAWTQPMHDPQADLEVRDAMNHIIETDERHLPRHRPGHSRQAIAERGAIGDVAVGGSGAANLLEDDLRYLARRQNLEWQDPKELAIKLIQGELVRFRDLPEKREVLKLAEEMAYRPEQEEETMNVGFEGVDGQARKELVKRLVGGKYEDVNDQSMKGSYVKGVARMVNGNATYPAEAKQMMLKTIMELMPDQGRPAVSKRRDLV